MKSMILIACLVISASAAPQKTVESAAVKSGKLQFSPADAQVYTGSIAQPAVAAVDQVIAGNVAVPQVYAAEQVVPGYYSNYYNSYPAGVVNSGVVYPGSVPYYSTGRSTVTTTTNNAGLPSGTVYEHHGTTHVGHLATAVHIKRPGQLYAAATPYYTAGLAAPGAVAVVPAHQIPAALYSQSWLNGQVQYINGQPAQYLNGQWYYVNAAAIPQYSSVYTNLRGQVVPAAAPAVVPAAVIPKVYAQPAYYRPAVQDTKWYTKTNTQQIAQPFWQAAAAGTKVLAVAAKPEQSAEGEKADW